MAASPGLSYRQRNEVLRELYPRLSEIRMRPSGKQGKVELSPGVETPTSELTILAGQPRLVEDAPKDASVGSAFHELLALRYGHFAWRTGDAAYGRAVALQVAKRTDSDPAWGDVRREAIAARRHLRADVIRAGQVGRRVARFGMVLGLHAALVHGGHILDDPLSRHSRLARSTLPEMMRLCDKAEEDALMKMLQLAAKNLPSPSQLTRTETELRCGHGSADLLVDDILLEVKTAWEPALTPDTVYPLIGKLLTAPPGLADDCVGGIRRAGWYFARHGVLWDFPVDELLSRLAPRPTTLEQATAKFEALRST